MDRDIAFNDFLEYSKSFFREKTIHNDQNIMDLGYCGNDTYDYIISLRDKFNVDFSNFDYLRYFYTEAECNTFPTLSFRKKDRVLEPFTFGQLYEYMGNHPSTYTKDLTLENLITYIRKNDLPSCFNEDSSIREWSGEGSEAEVFLKNLGKEFNVCFKNFDFKKYFYSNRELATHNFFFLVRKRKKRILEKLTARDLYKYMIDNKLDQTGNSV